MTQAANSRRKAPAARSSRTQRPATPKPDPVPMRARHDGWTPARQLAFIEALAASGCVAEAAASVGMDRSSAYRLRVRPEAQQFRLAWDAALDLAVRLVTDGAFSRAIHGVPVPHFYKGEQIGEHRRYDNRLAQFLMRYRDPLRYAATLDQMVYTGHPERAGVAFSRACNRLLDEAHNMPIVDDAPAEIPWSAEPIAEARHRETEQAIVQGSGPIYGDADRRWRLRQARAEHHETQRREREGSGGDGTGGGGFGG